VGIPDEKAAARILASFIKEASSAENIPQHQLDAAWCWLDAYISHHADKAGARQRAHCQGRWIVTSAKATAKHPAD
jgi:hypothetical protein